MPKSSLNVSLKAADDIFSTEESRQEEKWEQVQQIPLAELFPFKNHPFKVLDDESMLKKIVLFPISLFVAFLALMAKWLLTLSSYVVAPLMLYIFGCGIYTAYRQTWDQFFILLVAEFICFVLFFGATAITEGIGRFSEWLAEL